MTAAAIYRRDGGTRGRKFLSFRRLFFLFKERKTVLKNFIKRKYI